VKKSVTVPTRVADALAAQLFDSLDLRLGHREDDDPIDRNRHVDGVRSAKFRVNARRTADRGNIYAAADQSLNRARASGDINQLDVQTMALEYSRLFGDPRKRKSGRNRRIGHAQFLRRFSGVCLEREAV